MKKTVAGFVIGFVVAGCISISFLFYKRSTQFENGRHQGEISGRIEIWKFLNKHFGTQNSAASSKIIDRFDIKDVAIYIIEQDGRTEIRTKY